MLLWPHGSSDYPSHSVMSLDVDAKSQSNGDAVEGSRRREDRALSFNSLQFNGRRPYDTVSESNIERLSQNPSKCICLFYLFFLTFTASVNLLAQLQESQRQVIMFDVGVCFVG